MRFLAADHLAEHVLADRIDKEAGAGAGENRPEPRQHQHDEPKETHGRTQICDPAHRAVGDHQGRSRQSNNHEYKRAFEQNARRQSRPKNRRQNPMPPRLRWAAAKAEVDPPHRSHGGNDCQQQHRIGLGKPRLDTEQDRCREHDSRQDGGAARDKGERRPISQQHATDRADQRGNAVEPDGALRLRQSQRAGRFHDRRLQPINADRLFVAHVVLEADVDIVAGLHHLLGGLREARLVAIDRRDLKNPGRKARSEMTTSKAAARACPADAKSTKVASPRGQNWRALSVVVMVICRPIRSQFARTIEKKSERGKRRAAKRIRRGRQGIWRKLYINKLWFNISLNCLASCFNAICASVAPVQRWRGFAPHRPSQPAFAASRCYHYGRRHGPVAQRIRAAAF